MLRVRGGGYLLVLLEHCLLQPGLPADTLDQGAQEAVQAAHSQERPGLKNIYENPKIFAELEA